MLLNGLAYNVGIVCHDGPEWEVHRRFITRTFKDLGIGKETMEEKIMDELEEISKDLRTDPGIRKGQSEGKESEKDLEILFSGATANIISGLVFGETSKEDADFEGLVASITTMISDPPSNSLIARMCPKYEYYPIMIFEISLYTSDQ